MDDGMHEALALAERIALAIHVAEMHADGSYQRKQWLQHAQALRGELEPLIGRQPLLRCFAPIAEVG